MTKVKYLSANEMAIDLLMDGTVIPLFCGDFSHGKAGRMPVY